MEDARARLKLMFWDYLRANWIKRAAKFDELSDLELKPAVELVDDPTRHQLDEAVVTMLGLPKARALTTIEVCRKWWSLEPTVDTKDPV